MKLILILAIFSLFVEHVCATTFRISAQEETNHLTVQIDQKVQILKVGEVVNLNDLGKGVWNGSFFSISSDHLSRDNVLILSKNVPLSFNSFLATHCNVYSPGLTIQGNTEIDSLIARIKDQKNNQLNIKGSLFVKTFKMTGPVQIDGRLLLKRNGSFIFNNVGCNILTINGLLSSKGTLNIKDNKFSDAQIINNGTIFSETGVLYCYADTLINQKSGQIQGKEAKIFIGINGEFRNLGSLTLDQLLIKTHQH